LRLSCASNATGAIVQNSTIFLIEIPSQKRGFLRRSRTTTRGLFSLQPIKEEYDHRLRNATRIDLIGYGLSAFREDYAQEFEAWSGRADVRVLVIDPDFPAKQCSLADIRDVEENRPTGEIRREVERFEAELAGLASLDRTRFQCRRMRTIPAINLLRIDDEIFWGPYLMAEQSSDPPSK
jgi:hypothetical protein